MLTTISTDFQLRLVADPLTLVRMSTLKARLEAAMKHADKKQADLVRATKASSAAVTKWFGDSAKNLKMEHLFAVADECGVDPRWLATGKGQMLKSGKSEPCTHLDIPQRRIDLIRMYSRLPADVRQPIRALIETLAAVQNPRQAEYVKRTARKPDMVHEE